MPFPFGVQYGPGYSGGGVVPAPTPGATPGIVPTPVPEKRGFFQSLFGGPDLSAYAGLLSPDALKAMQGEADKRGRMGLAMGLLSASGVSNQRRGIGDILAAGIGGKMNAQDAYIGQQVPLNFQLEQMRQAQAKEGAATQKQQQFQQALAAGDFQAAALIDPAAVKQYRDALAPEKGPELPADVRAYEYAKAQGFKGTLQDWMLSQKRAGASQVNVNTQGAPEGFTWKDPANPMAGLVPIPGGPRDPNAPTEQQRNYSKQLSSFDNVLAGYEKTLAKLGPQFGPTANAAELKTAYTGLQLEAKNLAQLGALSGPDIKIMESLVIDPTSAYAQALGPEGLKRNLAALKEFLANKRAAYGGAAPGAPSTAQNEVTVDY